MNDLQTFRINNEWWDYNLRNSFLMHLNTMVISEAPVFLHILISAIFQILWYYVYLYFLEGEIVLTIKLLTQVFMIIIFMFLLQKWYCRYYESFSIFTGLLLFRLVAKHVPNVGQELLPFRSTCDPCYLSIVFCSPSEAPVTRVIYL